MSLTIKNKVNKTSSVQARLDTKTKEAAELVFELIGINSSQAINMFYKQVALKKALPFEVNTIIATSSTLKEDKEELNYRLSKDLVELEAGEDGTMMFDPKDIKPFKI